MNAYIGKERTGKFTGINLDSKPGGEVIPNPTSLGRAREEGSPGSEPGDEFRTGIPTSYPS